MQYQSAPVNFEDSIPTLVKWAKGVADKSSALSHRVETIWAPNLYSNYTFVTSSYRFRVDKGHPYYQLCEELLEVWLQEEAVLFLQVEFQPKLLVTLLTLDEEQCSWETLGESGYKLKDVKRRRKVPTPKTAKQSRAKPDDLEL